MIQSQQADASFDAFVRAVGERLRRALVAHYGVEIGSESTDAALAWGWERWERIGAMDNPAGYLYRVAQTHAHRALARGQRLVLPPEPGWAPGADHALPDGDLAGALRALPDAQRVAVLLVHAYGWTPAEVAGMTGSAAVTVRSHLRRGLRRLRSTLEEGTRS